MKTDAEVALFLLDRRVTLILLCFTEPIGHLWVSLSGSGVLCFCRLLSLFDVLAHVDITLPTCSLGITRLRLYNVTYWDYVTLRAADALDSAIFIFWSANPVVSVVALTMCVHEFGGELLKEHWLATFSQLTFCFTDKGAHHFQCGKWTGFNKC